MSVRQITTGETALRRVATLVSRGASPAEIFDAVAEEACRMVAAETVALVRFEPNASATLLAQSETSWASSSTGTRVALDGENVVVAVFHTGRAARVDDWADSTGALAALAQSVGIRSAVATPVVVEGSSWGAIVAGTTRCEPLPGDTEWRLQQFTDLVATAISNAEARARLMQLVEEHEALRHVALLVAQQPSSEAIFAAVAQAVGSVLGADVSGLAMFSDDNTATLLASWTRDGSEVPLGTRLPLDDDGVTARVFQSGAAARIDSYADGVAADAAREINLRSAVGAPILLRGKPWGVLGVGVFGGRGGAPLPYDAEARIAAFTELVSTAVSNAQATAEVRRLADEQAGLRRVATLVAQESSPVDVFVAVCEEASRVLGCEAAGLLRFEPDATATLLAQSDTPWDPPPLGTQFALDGENVVTQVLRTRQSARVDDWTGSSGAVAAMATVLGVRSTVAVPVAAEGRVWGVIIAATSRNELLAADIELRLGQFTELVATAIANATTRAELIASRARIVGAGDEARRRIERNLHDGTQQRLIALGLDLRRATDALPESDQDVRPALTRAGHDLESILDELRELSHGLHPPVLARLGLGPSLKALARRSPIPLQLDIELARRPEASLETALYYVVSEAVTNAIKHSQASEIHVAISGDPTLLASIEDNGIGGADPRGGSGLTGLLDRVDALGGRFTIESPPHSGTRISVEFPADPGAGVRRAGQGSLAIP